jgi:plasmid stability protein
MVLMLSIALAQDYTPPTEAEVRALLTESLQLDACRVREAAAIDQVGAEQDRALKLHAQVGACLDTAREVDAELVAQVESLTEALERSERRRGRLRTAGAVVLGVVVGLTVGIATR